MKRALELARKGEGLTRPNPPVGAVVVKNGRIIGSGYHRKAGGDHAEIIALKQAGRRARGAVLYVTLEPCSSYGRTPPCVHAIVKSGIASVIIAAIDPNPRHQGRGIGMLKKAGIEVIEGMCRAEGQKLIAPFKKWILTGKPYVSLKMAMSFDGKTADCRGCSRWITGKKARAFVHDLRRRADAVLVGAGTVLADNPSLLPRPANGRKTFRIIMDARGRLPPGAEIFRGPEACRTIVATTAACPVRRRRAWTRSGAQAWILPAREGRISPAVLMKKCGKAGFIHILCEGGSEAASSLIRAGIVDEYYFFLAPFIMGGNIALPAVGGKGWPLGRAPRLRFEECRPIGNDILIRAKPIKEDRSQ